MASYNRVILMGNLTRDIELRYTPAGTPVTDVGLAVNDRRKTQTGEWIDETTFVDVTFWGRTAEVASEYLSKGSPIFIEGRLKYDTWEAEGQKKHKLRVVCDRMQMLSSRTGEGGRTGEVGATRARGSSPTPQYGEAPATQYAELGAQEYRSGSEDAFSRDNSEAFAADENIPF